MENMSSRMAWDTQSDYILKQTTTKPWTFKHKAQVGKPESSVWRSSEGMTCNKGKEGKVCGGIRGHTQVLRASIRDSAVAGQADRTHQILRRFFPFTLLLEWDTEQEQPWRAPTILYHWPAPHSLLSAHFQSREQGEWIPDSPKASFREASLVTPEAQTAVFPAGLVSFQRL